MKIRVSEAKDVVLNWLVSESLGLDWYKPDYGDACAAYSTDWSQGGPIMNREKIDVCHHNHGQTTTLVTCTLWFPNGDRRSIQMQGQTPLVAAMRCYVASKLGDEIEIPKELL